MLFELAFHVGQRELGGVDGNLELAENPGQAADVVLVAVGEDDGADVLLVFNKVSDVGHNDVDAEQLRLGKHEPGVDDDDVVFPAEGEAVHAELAQPAEGDNFQFLSLHPSGSMLPPAPPGITAPWSRSRSQPVNPLLRILRCRCKRRRRIAFRRAESWWCRQLCLC